MVHTFSPGLWDFAEYALYHTEEDPRETADVKARYPEVLARMQALEAEWLERTLHGAPDPLARLGAENAQHGPACCPGGDPAPAMRTRSNNRLPKGQKGAES